MTINKCATLAIFTVNLLWMSGCFPSFEATTIQRESLKSFNRVESPTKAYLTDASVVLFPGGFVVRGDTVTGLGQRFWIEKSDTINRWRYIPLDSIMAMTSYDSKISFDQELASFLLIVTGTVMTPLSIYCISCPKCCFGSCPTVYTYNATDRTLQAELFSHSISRQLEDWDLDLLDYQPKSDSAIRLTLTNEAMETHYINKFSLLGVVHPVGTRVFPSESGSFVLFETINRPSHVVTRDGKAILHLVEAVDSLSYRTDLSLFPNLALLGEPDWVDVTVNIPEGTRKVKMLVRLKNTLLSTILFYEVVLASQGIDALNWIHRMNIDQEYAAHFKQVYETFSGVSVSSLHQGRWTTHSTIKDVGPITWKYVAMEFDVEEPGEFRIRLNSFPDNFELDYVGFSFDDNNSDQLIIREIQPIKAFNGTGSERDDIIPLILFDDDQYLVTNPGDSFDLIYPAQTMQNSKLTLFISSKGYYNEWIRGNWLRSPTDPYRFDLSKTKSTLSQLVSSWLRHKDEIEQTFLQTRVPIRRQQ